MTKKQIEQKVLDEVLTCHQLDENGEYVNKQQEHGTYQDGLIFALNLLRK